MKYSFFLVILLIPLNLFSQYLFENEEVLYSFKTTNNKRVVVIKEKNNEYIQYRFGTPDRIEMEFPAERNKESWALFQYIFYVRGGGKANSGQEIANLCFTNKGYKYLIYDTYFAESEKLATGILVTNLQNNKTTRIKGIRKNRKESLFFLDSETPLKFDEQAGFDF
ncbi:hypothetical protein FNJ88_00500 [Chryseobacterium sp. SNU WT5]|uniref:hypothetical protein n=1 Tax=Chryseobacterium sp. SNU WT5 TaxID=2594269 RepID=UPI00117FBA9A|nr:hypothetical protein [Chryseobacterium sp. SNU WT5]QDP84106.1 hypothetical protein FNJ88_00500 [Chryseobacterium sp. SNU WT5]